MTVPAMKELLAAERSALGCSMLRLVSASLLEDARHETRFGVAEAAAWWC
jgi:hypothetical protein